VIVAKFGGTSVGDAAAINRTVGIIRGAVGRDPVVVVSALAGATNSLLEIADRAGEGQLLIAIRLIEELRDRHLAVASEVLDAAGADRDTVTEIGALFDELAHLAEALSVLGHVTPRSRDAIAATGERASVPLVTGALRRCGVDAVAVDARDVMRTSDRFERADPLPEAIAAALQEHVVPVVRAHRIPVLGGYIGATAQGVTTTLGRGGSDYSAALFAAALGADAIEIWTDVDGILTADPRVVPEARPIPDIRFDEASELASFGARVLHPATIAPAVRRGIPVFVFNSRRPPPEGRGTRITFDAPPPREGVRAVAAKPSVIVVRVRSTRMLHAHGVLRAIFEVFERNRTSVDVVATSEVSVSVTLDDAGQLDAVVAELSALGDVTVERSRGVVALVGAGLGENTPAMARALAALGDVRVHMCSLSATGINLTVVVDAPRVADAMRRLHGEFFGTGVTP
jgi:aspartate kinase